jgi:hypothetical protein
MLPADFVPAIGKLAVAWGFFEDAFDRFLEMLATAEGVHEDKWRGLSFRRRRKLFSKLIACALGDCPSAIQLGAEIVRDSEPAYQNRNIVVHGRLSTGFTNHDGSPIVSLVCVGRANRKEVQSDFTADQLDDMFYDIAHLSGRLHLLETGNLPLPPSSPEIPRLLAFLSTNRQPDPKLPMPQTPPRSSTE